MTDTRPQERRLAIREQTHSIGITDDYIDHLVETFYDKIRQHDVLGPVFEQAIGENWAHHLARMKDFWASVTLNTGQYSGQPVPAHKKHSEAIEEWHFEIWLGLFQQTLEETASSPEAIEYFMVRANRIAASLKLAIFGLPSLRSKAE